MHQDAFAYPVLVYDRPTVFLTFSLSSSLSLSLSLSMFSSALKMLSDAPPLVVDRPSGAV